MISKSTKKDANLLVITMRFYLQLISVEKEIIGATLTAFFKLKCMSVCHLVKGRE